LVFEQLYYSYFGIDDGAVKYYYQIILAYR
jgi:hypothetical protein